MISKVISAVIKGIEAVPVTIETDIVKGMPNLTITGLADATVREAAIRVRAAIINSGYDFPLGRISINIAPAGIRKRGSALDLGLAVGLLAASGQIPSGELETYVIAGELSLDGTLCPTPGMLNVTEEAAKSGLAAVIPEANLDEARIIKGGEIYPVCNLAELAGHFRKREIIEPVIPSVESEDFGFELRSKETNNLDFADVKGQEGAKRALMIAAAGGHGVLMTGSPSTGKTMLAERLPGIMPPMSYEEIVKTTEVYSAAGKLTPEMPYIIERPFRRPHHTITAAGLIGGGQYPRPGEITLASSGILFLDEFAEMDPKVADTLREPLERKRIVLIRNGETYTFPADFLLVAATNPCRCGYYGDPEHECTCTPGEIARYRQKISGPVLDRIDIHLELKGVAYDDLERDGGMSTEYMRERVMKARVIQENRFKEMGIMLNSEMTDRMVSEVVKIDDEGRMMLRNAYDALKLNPRTLSRTVKISRTIADIDERESVSVADIAEALQYSRCGKDNRD